MIDNFDYGDSMLKQGKYLENIQNDCICRLKESKVLVVGFHNSCTELARHLTLSGVTVHFVQIVY
jgi:hypothetical protein